MSLTAAAIQLLAELGVSALDIARVAAANEQPVETRSKAALRTERWRKKKASQTVTGDVTVTSQPPSQEASQTVTNRHIGDAPRARGLDNPLKVVLSGYAAAAEARANDDWPDHPAEALVAAVASSRLDPTRQPGLLTTAGRVTSWKAQGASYEHDVLPTIRGLMSKTGPPIKTWQFFDAAIGETIAANRRALEIPTHERSHPSPTAKPRSLAALGVRDHGPSFVGSR